MANIVAEGVDGVYGLFNADESFSNVYTIHDKANLALPGITVGPGGIVERAADDSFTTDGVFGVPWDVTVSIRCHIAYTGGTLDQDGLVDLVDDVIIKLRKNHAAITSFKLGSVTVDFNQLFAESETVGAQVNATYLTHDQYTQE